MTRKSSRYQHHDVRKVGYSDHKGLVSWVKTMELIQLQKGQKLETLNAVKDSIRKCLRGWDEVLYDVRFGALVARNRYTQLPFEMLSDGVRNILAMAGDIAYRAATLNPHLRDQAPSKTPGIVLIEEIDLHLHPLWQREVVDDLRSVFPAMQFIVTTHSLFITRSLQSDEIINLDDRNREPRPSHSVDDMAEEVIGIECSQPT